MMQRSLNHGAQPGTDDRLSMENVKYRSVRRTFRKGRKFNLFALMYRRKCAQGGMRVGRGKSSFMLPGMMIFEIVCGLVFHDCEFLLNFMAS